MQAGLELFGKITAMPEAAQESLQLLLDVCLLLSSKTELPDVLTSIMQLASRVVKAETASLLLLDPKTKELYFDVALGLDPEVSKIRLKLGQGIAGSVAKEGKPMVINDVKNDPRWTAMVDAQSGFVTRSIMASPMEIKGRLVGVVEAINHIEGPFSLLDLRVFEAFAAQAAIAIENARLFASLREEKTKLDTVFARMNDAAVLTDEKGGVLLCNNAAHKLCAVGKTTPGNIAEQLVSLKVRPSIPEILGSHKPFVPFEASRELPKKLILAGTCSFLEFDAADSVPGWKGRLFVFRDVTDERQEETLKRSFLSLISHKLKTPLSSITGYAQILIDESPAKNSDMAVKGLNAILTQGQKLTDLVDRLLRFTTIEELDTSAFPRKPFSIDESIGQTVDAMKEWLLGQKGAVLFEGGSGATAFGDRALVNEVIKNLIENGIKFSTKPQKKVAVWAETKDAFVTIHIRDQGPGIPPEDQEKIFNKFHQIESSFTGQVEGWGLGLPFVKKVVEQHGGTLSLQSQLGKGTTVTFTLPTPPKT